MAIAPAAAQQPPGANTNINRYGHDITLQVPLREFGPLGQITITITKDQKVLILVKDLEAALSREVTKPALAKLHALADSNGFVTLNTLTTAGYRAEFNSSAVEIVIHIPDTDRSAQSITVGATQLNLGVQPDQSAGVGAFLNYRVGEVYQINGGTGSSPAQLQGDFELGGRIAQTLSFDNFATYNQSANDPFVRTASRVMFDLPSQGIRLTGGDLLPEGTGFQNSLQVTGVGIDHLSSEFGSYFSTFTNSGSNVTLTRPSQVQVYINDLPVSTLHLGPGNYDLRNLPLAAGANNIKAVITDDTGQTRTVYSSYFTDIDLLSPGEDQYSGSIGILAPLGTSGPDYMTNEPAFSGYYQRGLTETLTAGANLQATRQQQMLGLSANIGTTIGLFNVDVAASNSQHLGSGMALRAQYRYLNDAAEASNAQSFDASIEYRTSDFVPPDQPSTLLQPEDREFLIAFDGTQPIAPSLSLVLNANYLKARSKDGDSAAASALVQWTTPYDATVGAGIAYQWTAAPQSNLGVLNRRGFTFLVSLTKSFGDYGSLSVTADRFEQRADYNRPALNQQDDYFLQGDIDHTALGYIGNATAGYQTDRGDVSAVYSTSLNPDGSIAGNQVGAFVAGSLDFADGRFGIGRSVYDGFAIVDADETLEGHKVSVVSPYDQTPVASTGALGPAVVPLSAYQPQALPYNVEDLPLGYDLGTGAFNLYPWYHAGYALTVGSPYNITVLGHLLNAEGKPVMLQSGVANNPADPKAPTREVVSNATGRFAALGLSPGKWHIKMFSGLEYDIDIVKSTDRLVNVGDIKPSGGKP